jgi:hypothetical protein
MRSNVHSSASPTIGQCPGVTPYSAQALDRRLRDQIAEAGDAFIHF